MGEAEVMRGPAIAACAMAVAAILTASNGYAQEQQAEQREPWMSVVKHEDASKIDYGGFFIIPEVHAPIFVTDPLRLDRAKVLGNVVYGYGLDWRLGLVFRRVSVEVIGGYASYTATGTITRGAEIVTPATSSATIGAQSRYYLTNDSGFTPFAGLGVSATRFSSTAAVRASGAVEEVEGAWGPSAHALLGTLVRIGRPSSVFLQVGVRPEVHAPNGLFDEPQVVVAPYVALSTFGVEGAKPR